LVAEPALLHYESRPARDRASAFVTLWRSVVCTLLFAAAHLSCEYPAQYAYWSVSSFPERSYARVKAVDRLEENMVIETGIVIVAGIFILVTQLILHPRYVARLRGFDWAIAIVLGAAFCGIRWGTDFLGKAGGIQKSGLLGLVEAIALAVGSGLILVNLRWVRFSGANTAESGPLAPPS
jgi:hypothetical protein